MSSRDKNGTHYQNQELAAELRNQTAHVHSSAAIEHGKQDHLTGPEHTRLAAEHSHKTHERMEADEQRVTNEHGFVVFGHEDIAQLAYTLWHERGCPEGSPEEDWYHAVAQLRARR